MVKKSWKIKSVEMLKTFNCGIGLILATKVKNSKEVLNFFKNINVKSYILGRVFKNPKTQKKILIKNFGQWDLT